MFWALCSCGDLQVPRKNEGAVGLPDADDLRGKEVWGSRLGPAFRQSFDTVDFSKINQSLYATTFLAYGGGRQKFCPDCMMADHSQEECALNPSRATPVVQVQDAGAGGSRLRGQEMRRKRERAGPCYAWNDGRCTFARCRYEHVCSRCGGEHKKNLCREGFGEKRREQGPKSWTLNHVLPDAGLNPD